MGIPEASSSHYEFGKHKKGEWVDMRTKPDVHGNWPNTVDYSLWYDEELGINKTDMEKVWGDILRTKKLKYQYPNNTTLQDYYNYVKPHLEGFALLYKHCRKGYDFLMRQDFKINFITSGWYNTHKKRGGSDPDNCGGFWCRNENPPGIYINMAAGENWTYKIAVLHEILHGLSSFCGEYYSENPCKFFKHGNYYGGKYQYLSDLINQNYKIQYINGGKYNSLDLLLWQYNEKFKKFSQELKLKNIKIEGLSASELKAAANKHGLWMLYLGYDMAPNIEEFFTGALTLYLHPKKRKVLKKLGKKIHDIIEQIAIPLMEEANRGMAKQKLFKPQRGEGAEYH